MIYEKIVDFNFAFFSILRAIIYIIYIEYFPII